jgi:DNA-binding NarL/FixJ family response regulator
VLDAVGGRAADPDPDLARGVPAEHWPVLDEGDSAALTSRGDEVVGKAADEAGAVEAVLRLRPDIAVLDVRMPPSQRDDGARAAVAIRMQSPEQAVLLLSQHIETRHSVALVSQGRFGYLLKDRVLDVDEFLVALDRVASGDTALDPEVVRRLITAARATSALDALTPRETDVLELMAEGRSNRAIAQRLWLTTRTVETHISSIMTKLGLANAADDHRRVLAVLAYLAATGRTAPT